MKSNTSLQSGELNETMYHVFPGVDFIYIDAHTDEATIKIDTALSENAFEILHCKEGRVEYSMSDKFCYLSAGDLAVKRTIKISQLYFPLRHFHGLCIRIDPEKAPRCFSCLLDDVNVKPKALFDKFCRNDIGFSARLDTAIEHIFSELYSVQPKIRKGYHKIKTMELLLFLSVLDINSDEHIDRSYTQSQVTLAKDISRYLTDHMNDKITIEKLSSIFHVSSPYIKTVFKGVYGVPVSSYIRARRMESAAYMLEYTNKSILEIAGEHGYDNGSKFANAFRSIKGQNPTDYRNSLIKKQYPNGA